VYRILIKPILFLFQPERAHQLAITLLRLALSVPGVPALLRQRFQRPNPRLEKSVMGLSFKNPIGLAAGFDKNGTSFPQMAALGFGFIELGTVTPRPQPGNAIPRLFRLPTDHALINRMGFNNLGADALAKRLKETPRPQGLIIGGNIGKNKTTPNDQAADDYLYCFRTLFPLVDYFVVNVSSPNTPNLRELQDKEPLSQLLHSLQAENRKYPQPKPILLKIAPDVTESQLDDILELVQTSGIQGVVATNTTISRNGLNTPKKVVEKIGAGGLSGAPLRDRSTEIIRYLRQNGAREMVIIGVGGIHSAETALEKIEAGADLIQIYTGFIFEGPGLLTRIQSGL